MLGTRTKSDREKALLYCHQDMTAGPSDFRKIKLHRRTVLCYYSRKCRWHRPKASKIKFIKIMDIRINRKCELSYTLKWTLSRESFTGECIWTRGHSWSTHSYTHLPGLHQLMQRGEGRKGTLHKTFHCARKTWDQTVTRKLQNGKISGSSFSLVSVFLNKHSQRGFISK